METALGAANWLLGKVLNKLTEDLVAGFVASRELGLNFDKIKIELYYTLGLLHAAQGRDVSYNPGLQPLLEELSKKADEAEDALDELHYFMIQDELDGTQEATPELGDGLGAQAQHARHAARNTAGNWLSHFSCCHSQDDVAAVTENISKDKSHNNTSKAAKSVNHTDGGDADKLSFDRVAMSNKIKLLIEDMHSLCPPISELLKINTSSSIPPRSIANSLERPAIGSTVRQEKLYGRSAIFEQIINHMTSDTFPETLSVLTIVGPGGIGKTTFTQHLYNDKRNEEHFTVRVWVCVSTNFDVLKLTKEIRSCIPADEHEGSNRTDETNNLDQLQKSIARRLKSKRFLIVFDDIWQCRDDMWVNLLAPFTTREVEKGSMVIVTTRFPYIAQMVKTNNLVNLEGLEPAGFWEFFQLCIFGEITPEHDKEDLIDIAKKVASKLKCSPLAAKTVGRLLKKKLSWEHWMEILEKKEWLNQTHDDDIMPALKISYEYLPFHLQKCFSYCALFPKDYKFDSLKISCFWISIGIIDSNGQNGKTDADMGSKCLNELLDNGFLMKGDGNYYVMHDLLHELAQVVSSKECAHISYSSFRARDIPSSIRHLSISMEDKYDENFEEEMGKLKRRIDIENLQSLMFFGECTRTRVVNIIKDTFKEIKALRVLFIFMNSPNSLPHNFSKLVHLRYLKLKSHYGSNACLPSTVSRFYHLQFLDIWEIYSNDCPKDISRLVNLRHFFAEGELHSNVSGVGKMKFLQELKKFHVKKESIGFELRELGRLEELGGELFIYGLENVRTKEEANEARLMAKRNLNMLGLAWDGEQQLTGDDILDGLHPHSNLRALCIVNHGGATGPSWLCSNIHIKNLERLYLQGVSWGTLPPIGQIHHLRELRLKNIVGIYQFGPDLFGSVTEKSFTHLKIVEFDDMPELVEWVGGANSHLFSRLERINCTHCPKLAALPFSGCIGSSTQDNTIWFPNLCHLCIDACPKLCLPPLPHTSMLSYVYTDYMVYNGTELHIDKPCELVFDYLGQVESLKLKSASLVPFTDLQKLHPLRSIEVTRSEEAFMRGLDDGIVLHSVQSLHVGKFPVTRKSLPKMFKCFPSLSRLVVSSSDEYHDDEEVVLQFPPSSSLSDVELHRCKNLVLPVEHVGGFHGLLSLKSVCISDCAKLFSQWPMRDSSAQSMNPFPPSLKILNLVNERSTMSMAPLSNLTSLTSLEIENCKNISVDGFNPHITSNLDNLVVYNSRDDETGPYSIAADLLAEVARAKAMPTGSFQLVHLHVDSISVVLVSPICSRLSATLRSLWFLYDWRAESFTEEQDKALRLLASLEWLSISYCRLLQCLPPGLHCLSSLVRLEIWDCPKIRSLPKDGFPDSLQSITVLNCCAELNQECRRLRGTRPDIFFLTDQD